MDQQCQWPEKFSFRAQKLPGEDHGSDVGNPSKRSSEPDETESQSKSVPSDQDVELPAPSFERGDKTPSRGIRMSLDNILNPHSSNRSKRSDHRSELGSAVQISPTQARSKHVQFPETPGRSWLGYDELIQQSSPESLADDGIFLPGSQYRQLHQQLRTGILNTALPKSITRDTSLKQSTQNEAINDSNTFIDGAESKTQLDVAMDVAGQTEPVLSRQQECVLWQNWVMEISSWLDKFDSKRHSKHVLPNMAKRHECLKFSILALSARQLERKDGSLPASVSLALYQKAINCLLPQLHTKSVACFASCVVLCVLEMFSCSPKAWRRHLDGCASLIQAKNIRGDGGGVEQALFWTFARMDVCGALISSEPTLIPVDRWTTQSNFEADREMFLSSNIFENYANYACYLCARVVDLFTRAGEFKDPMDRSSYMDPEEYQASWSILFDQIEQWYGRRPEEMVEIISLSAEPIRAASQPFDTILFSNGAAISGNQMFHTAALLMLQRKPKGISKPSLWHARKICAISLSNSHHGCWTNCIQPIWFAGQLMSHPSEHRAILDLFKMIEMETGWGATWRAQDLQAFWGDLR